MTTIAVTGATGQLGQRVIDALLRTVPAADVVALVRDPAKAGALAAQGVQVRQADYDQPASWGPALAGVRKLLLISSSNIGSRLAQHQVVIEAAKAAGVQLLAYTSLLKADSSPLGLADEHRQTEAALRASGLPVVILRNGWYAENHTVSIPAALQHGAVLGSAGDGRVSLASRADYADAAAAVLTSPTPQAGRVHELAGDQSFSLAELAAEISRQAGKPVAYVNLPMAEHEAALLQAGLPAGLASLLADADAGTAKGALFEAGRGISALNGRPTVTLAQAVAAALPR